MRTVRVHKGGIMGNKSVVVLASVISFIIGTVVGTGAYWKYQELELSKVKATTDLRDQISKLMDDVITTTAAFKSLNLCEGETTETHNKAIKLRAKLKLYQQDFEELEKKLAKLEGREPRIINFDFSQPCPPSLHIKIK